MFKKELRAVLMSVTCLLGCQSVASTATAAQPLSSGRPNYILDHGQKLLGNNNYPAISYSGYRKTTRTIGNTPTLKDTKEDLKILSAMGVKVLRSYNTQQFPHSERILRAIRELKQADADFDMYVMLGAWIQCNNAYAEGTDHNIEDAEQNQKEIKAAIRLADEYSDIVKIIAVGNEAMVTWQAHFVPASTILKYVNVLKEARRDGRIPAKTLVTTSDNWAALGGTEQYRSKDLAELMRQIDFVSLHTYAFHDTYYNQELKWSSQPDEADLPVVEQIAKSVERAIALQKSQYKAVQDYLKEIGVDKDIHIGETGWASQDNSHYGDDGTCAASEYSAKLFYDATMKWTQENNLTCFYFEAFDEPWKSKGTAGSEGHFGLFTVEGKAKYALWDLVDIDTFVGLKRGGHSATKTHGGDKAVLLKELKAPKHKKH
jgi:exo-beta-1,3-glucanase (GH17 family)